MTVRARDLAVLLGIEYRASIGRYVFPVAFGIELYLVWIKQPQGLRFWSGGVQAIEIAIILIGPFWLAVAVLVGRRDQQIGHQAVRTLGVQPPEVLSGASVVALAMYAIASHLLASAVLIVDYVRHGAWGHFPLLPFATTSLSVLLYVSAGYCIGRWIPRYLAAAAGAICMFMFSTWLSVRGTGVVLLLPYYDMLIDVWLDWRPGLYARHAVFLALLLAVSVMLTTMRDRPTRATGSLTVAVVGLAGVVGWWVSSIGISYYASSITEFEYLCAGESPVICLHPAFGSGMEAVASEVTPVAARLRGTPGEIRRLEQQPGGVDAPLSPGATPIQLDDLSPAAVSYLAPQLLQNQLDLDRCWDVADDERSPNGKALTDLVFFFLLTGYPIEDDSTLAESEWFDRLSVPDRQAWLSTHWTRYTTCALTEDDFGWR